MSYQRIYIFTAAERSAWEAQQDPSRLPTLDLQRIAATRRWRAEQRRIAAIQASRAATRAAKKG